MNVITERKLNELIVLILEEKASDEQVASFYSILSENPGAVDHYIEYLSMVSCLLKADARVLSGFNHNVNDGSSDEDDAAGSQMEMDSNVSVRGINVRAVFDDSEDCDLFENDLTAAKQELLEMEKTAPAVVIPKDELERELIQKVVYPPRPKRKLSRFQKFELAACVAIVMLFTGIIFFMPAPVILPVVAELEDSIDAVWDSKLQKPDEYGDMVQSRYCLEKGYASILFNDGANVTVEAPAEFSLNSTGDMELYKGRIYAIVPPEAHGFAVKACGSKIVDLGTEFGVEVEGNNKIQLHVTRGKTRLFARLLTDKESQVDAGAAKKIYEDGSVEDIPLAGHRFVRRIDSAAGTISKARSDGIRTADSRDIFSVNLWATGAMKEGSGWQDPATHETLKLRPGQAAGAGSWRTTGWENIQIPNPFDSFLEPTKITSSRGSTATLKIISQRNAGPWNWVKPRGYSDAVDTGNAVLLTGHVNGTSVPSDNGRYIFEMMVSDIPFGTYDVIIYLGANKIQVGDGTGKVILNDIERSFKVPASEPNGTLIEGGNFVVFKGVSGSSFSLKAMGQGDDGFNHIGPAGFQIVSNAETADWKDFK